VPANRERGAEFIRRLVQNPPAGLERIGIEREQVEVERRAVLKVQARQRGAAGEEEAVLVAEERFE
jgi:hypothetical protein